MLQKKPRIQPMSWSLTTLLLAACGGGGGGTPTTTFTREGADAALANSSTPAVDVVFIEGTNGRLSGPISENSQRFNVKQAVSAATGSQIDSTSIRIDSVEFVGPLKANVVFSGTAATGQRVSIPIEVLIQGADAERFELVSIGSNGTTIMQFKSDPDYERPLDSDGDGVYRFDAVFRYGNTVETTRYELRITDTNDGSTTVPSPAGRSSVPAHTREGDVIKITIVEGDTELFLANSDNLSSAFGVLFTGPDADKFQAKRVPVDGTQRSVIEFKEAPDFEAPADAGENNVYNFAMADEDLIGDISFEITVIDNPNEIL